MPSTARCRANYCARDAVTVIVSRHTKLGGQIGVRWQHIGRVRVLWSSRCHLMIWCSCCGTIKSDHRTRAITPDQILSPRPTWLKFSYRRLCRHLCVLFRLNPADIARCALLLPQQLWQLGMFAAILRASSHMSVYINLSVDRTGIQHKAGAADGKKSFDLTDRFGDHLVRLTHLELAL